MHKRIKLSETEFELPEPIHYTKDQDVVLGIRLFNLTLARKVKKQILNDQKIVEALAIHLNNHEMIFSYTNNVLEHITKHGKKIQPSL